MHRFILVLVCLLPVAMSACGSPTTVSAPSGTTYVITARTVLKDLSANTSSDQQFIISSCQPGEIVLSGGFNFKNLNDVTQPTGYVQSSFPSDAQGNPSANPTSWTIGIMGSGFANVTTHCLLASNPIQHSVVTALGQQSVLYNPPGALAVATSKGSLTPLSNTGPNPDMICAPGQVPTGLGWRYTATDPTFYPLGFSELAGHQSNGIGLQFIRGFFFPLPTTNIVQNFLSCLQAPITALQLVANAIRPQNDITSPSVLDVNVTCPSNSQLVGSSALVTGEDITNRMNGDKLDLHIQVASTNIAPTDMGNQVHAEGIFPLPPSLSFKYNDAFMYIEAYCLTFP